MGKTVGKILADKKNPPPSVRSRLTGNSGYAFQDGTMRGAIAFICNGVLLLAATATDALTTEQWAITFTLVNPALFVAFGWYDSRRK